MKNVTASSKDLLQEALWDPERTKFFKSLKTAIENAIEKDLGEGSTVTIPDIYKFRDSFEKLMSSKGEDYIYEEYPCGIYVDETKIIENYFDVHSLKGISIIEK